MHLRRVIDLETNGLLQGVTKIHCMISQDVDNSASELYVGEEKVKEFIDYLVLHPEIELIGHNLFYYDLMVIKKLYRIDFALTHKIHDTMILGQLLYPDMYKEDENESHGLGGKVFSRRDYGSHSLKAYGQRCMSFKGEYDGGWESYNDAMGRYCILDGQATKTLFLKLLSKVEEKTWK